MTRERLLRAAALLVAVLGWIDPAISANRAVRPRVVVMDASPTGADASDLVLRLRRSLSSHFDVANAPDPDAAATIVAGNSVPSFARSLASPVFVLTPNPSPGSVVITAIRAPESVAFESRARLSASLRVVGGRGRTVEVRASGASFTTDRVERVIESDDQGVSVDLALVPIARGLGVVQVHAQLKNGPASTARADVAIEVVDRTWTVLFYDLRPSWSSTFARRAIEQDTRFAVASRTATSRGVATGTTNAPASLRDPAALAPFDAIVVGGPDAMTREDAAALEHYARRRGGSIVLLVERPSSQISALTGVAHWTDSVVPDPEAIQVADSTARGLQAADLWVPAALPSGARVLAWTGTTKPARPVVIDVPLGAGRVMASGLVDAWRYRGVPGESLFDDFWREALADSAAAAPSAIQVELPARLLRPGQDAALRVVVRDEALADPAAPPASSRVAATVTGGGSEAPLRLWPDHAPGLFTADLRAPAEPGNYRLTVVSGSHSVDVPLLVASDAARPQPDESSRLSAWAASTGGWAFTESDFGGLESAIDAAIPRELRPGSWRPMRSPWWLVAFAAALSGEWWLRRRRQAR